MKKIFSLLVVFVYTFNTFAIVRDSLKIQELFIADSIEHIDNVKTIKGIGELHIGDSFDLTTSRKYSDRFCNNIINGGIRGWIKNKEWINNIPKYDYILDIKEVDSIVAFSNYINNKTNVNIKAYNIYDYKIDDDVIDVIHCAFYKNKLVAISFHFNDNKNYEFLEYCIKKYGNGCKFFPDGENDDWMLKYVDRSWSNEKVTLKYCGFFKNEFMIISNDGDYDKFINEIEIYYEQYKSESSDTIKTVKIEMPKICPIAIENTYKMELPKICPIAIESTYKDVISSYRDYDYYNTSDYK